MPEPYRRPYARDLPPGGRMSDERSRAEAVVRAALLIHKHFRGNGYIARTRSVRFRAAVMEARAVRASVRIEALTAALRVIPPDKLEALAAWLDLQDAHDRRNGDEVQRDLRRMASLARAALASGKDKP